MMAPAVVFGGPLLAPLMWNQSGDGAAATRTPNVIWGLLLLELATRLLTATDQMGFVRRRPIDFLALPLPFLRPLRLLRLVRFLPPGADSVLFGDSVARARAVLRPPRSGMGAVHHGCPGGSCDGSSSRSGEPRAGV